MMNTVRQETSFAHVPADTDTETAIRPPVSRVAARAVTYVLHSFAQTAAVSVWAATLFVAADNGVKRNGRKRTRNVVG